MVSSACRRAAVHELRDQRGYSERRACALIGCPRSTSQYRFKRTADLGLLALIHQLVEENRRSGYRKLHFILRRDHAIAMNHKRFYRIYRAADLQVRRRIKRHARYVRGATSPTVTRPNERRSMDFVHDTLANGRNVRLLTVIDDFTAESIAIEIDSSLPARNLVSVWRLPERMSPREPSPEETVAIVMHRRSDLNGSDQSEYFLVDYVLSRTWRFALSISA